jgi:hypothetical protein
LIPNACLKADLNGAEIVGIALYYNMTLGVSVSNNLMPSIALALLYSNSYCLWFHPFVVKKTVHVLGYGKRWLK